MPFWFAHLKNVRADRMQNAVPHKGLNRPLALVVGVDLNQRFRPIAAIFILALDLVLEVGCCDLDEAA